MKALGRSLLLIAVLFPAAVLLPELTVPGGVYPNDGALHLPAIERLQVAAERSEGILDCWTSEWICGYPMWRSYQPLGHLATLGIHYLSFESIPIETLYRLLSLPAIGHVSADMLVRSALAGGRSSAGRLCRTRVWSLGERSRLRLRVRLVSLARAGDVHAALGPVAFSAGRGARVDRPHVGEEARARWRPGRARLHHPSDLRLCALRHCGLAAPDEAVRGKAARSAPSPRCARLHDGLGGGLRSRSTAAFSCVGQRQ